MSFPPFDNRNGPDERDPLWQRIQAFEVLVFLFLIVPSTALSLFAVRQGQLNFPLVAVAVMTRDLALVCLIFFFLWRNGESHARIGWTFKNVSKEIAVGIALFVPFFAGADAVGYVLKQFGLTAPATPLPSFLTARDLPQVILAFAMVIVVAISEETIFRGYLLLRFGATMRSMRAAVVISSLLFALGHGYEGTLGLATVAIMGIVLAGIYLWRQSLVAPIVVHFLQDFVGIVVASILGMK